MLMMKEEVILLAILLFQLWIKELGQVEDLNKEIIDDIIMISKNELDISGKNLFIPA